MWASYVFLMVTAVLAILYIGIIIQYTKWFKQLSTYSPTIKASLTRFSIIIPARNEENNIEKCILSIYKNKYPDHLFEVIVIDDHSTDTTAKKVIALQHYYANLKLIKLADALNHQPINSYKKKAIEVGIANASFEWIITTDADCTPPADWLELYDSYIQKKDVVFIAAPVLFKNTGSWLSIFQCLDFLVLQGITAASVSAGYHSMCNGANIAYSKNAFFSVNGFKDVDKVASGDDMLLMGRIKKEFPDKIGYLFSPLAIVYTDIADSWKALLNQRIRWASKAPHYKDNKIFLVLLIVYLFNVLLLILPFTALYDVVFLSYWGLLVLVKAGSEFFFLLYVSKFYKQQQLLKWFFLMQPLHIIYTVVVGWLGKFGSYHWKGRVVK